MANDVLQGAAIPAWGQVPEGNAFWYDPNVPRPCEDLNHQERAAEATRSCLTPDGPGTSNRDGTKTTGT